VFLFAKALLLIINLLIHLIADQQATDRISVLSRQTKRAGYFYFFLILKLNTKHKIYKKNEAKYKI